MGFLLLLACVLVVAGAVWLIRRRNKALSVDDVPLAHRDHIRSESNKYPLG